MSVRKPGFVPGDRKSFFRKANCFVCSELRICTGRYEVFLQKGKLLCLFGNQDLYREIGSLSSERQITLSVRKPGFVLGDMKSFFRKANRLVFSGTWIFYFTNFFLVHCELGTSLPFHSSSMMMIDYLQRPERRQKRRLLASSYLLGSFCQGDELLSPIAAVRYQNIRILMRKFSFAKTESPTTFNILLCITSHFFSKYSFKNDQIPGVLKKFRRLIKRREKSFESVNF